MIYIYCFGTNKRCDTIDKIKNSGGFYVGMELDGRHKLNREMRKLLGEDAIYQILTKLAPNILSETAERKKWEKLSKKRANN